MLTNLEEKKFKEKIFGTIHISPKSGIFDPNAIKEPFVKPTSVIYTFCANCGLLYEVDQITAETLFASADLPYAIHSGEYLELGSCGSCGLAEYTVKLKKISIN